MPKISIFFCLTKIVSQNIKNIIASQISLKKQLFDSFLYSDILARQLQSKNRFQIITHTTHVSTENILRRILPLLFIVCTKFKTMWKTMLNKLKCKSCVSFCKSKKIMHISAFTTSHPMNATSDFWISILHLCSNSGGKNHNFQLLFIKKNWNNARNKVKLYYSKVKILHTSCTCWIVYWIYWIYKQHIDFSLADGNIQNFKHAIDFFFCRNQFYTFF